MSLSLVVCGDKGSCLDGLGLCIQAPTYGVGQCWGPAVSESPRFVCEASRRVQSSGRHGFTSVRQVHENNPKLLNPKPLSPTFSRARFVTRSLRSSKGPEGSPELAILAATAERRCTASWPRALARLQPCTLGTTKLTLAEIPPKFLQCSFSCSVVAVVGVTGSGNGTGVGTFTSTIVAVAAEAPKQGTQRRKSSASSGVPSSCAHTASCRWAQHRSYEALLASMSDYIPQPTVLSGSATQHMHEKVFGASVLYL